MTVVGTIVWFICLVGSLLALYECISLMWRLLYCHTCSAQITLLTLMLFANTFNTLFIVPAAIYIIATRFWPYSPHLCPLTLTLQVS
jgi:hypothetical protein